MKYDDMKGSKQFRFYYRKELPLEELEENEDFVFSCFQQFKYWVNEDYFYRLVLKYGIERSVKYAGGFG